MPITMIASWQMSIDARSSSLTLIPRVVSFSQRSGRTINYNSMGERGMADAFKGRDSDPQEQLKQRLAKIEAKLKEQAAMGERMTDTHRKAMEAAATYFDSINPGDPDAEGKVGFLEYAFSIGPNNLRGF